MRFFRKQAARPDLPLQDGYKAALSREVLIRQFACYIAELRSLVALPERHFSQLYLSPIANYLAFTQHCAKEVAEQHFQKVISGLKRRRALLLPPGVAPEVISHQKDLWTYVAFTWLLLYQTADQINGYGLVYKNPEELDSQARKWCPFHGALAPPRRFKIMGQLPVSLCASPALLPLILPLEGLTWLYSDSRAINTLLDSLVFSDKDSPLSTLLEKSAKAAAEFENVAIPETQPLGQQFRDWLLQALAQEFPVFL